MTKQLHDRFLAILPRVENHARIYFRHVKCRVQQQEAIGETIALAWKWFVRLVQRGKNVAKFPNVLLCSDQSGAATDVPQPCAGLAPLTPGSASSAQLPKYQLQTGHLHLVTRLAVTTAAARDFGSGRSILKWTVALAEGDGPGDRHGCFHSLQR